MALDLEISKVDLLFRQNIAGWIAIMFNSATYVYLSQDVLPPSFLIPWYLILNTSAVVRILASRKWRRVREKIASPSDLRPWSAFIFLALLVSGTCWGAIGWQFMACPEPLHAVMTTLLIAGMSAGALASYSSSLSAMYAVVIPAMIPRLARVALTPGRTYHIMAMLLVLYTVLLVRLGRNLNRYVEAAFRLTLEKEKFASDLRAEVQVKEQATAALRESEERYRLALDSSQAMGWSWQPESDDIVFQGNLPAVIGIHGDGAAARTKLHATHHRPHRPRKRR